MKILSVGLSVRLQKTEMAFWIEKLRKVYRNKTEISLYIKKGKKMKMDLVKLNTTPLKPLILTYFFFIFLAPKGRF